MEKRRLSGGQIVAIVVSVCAAVVLAPVGVMAATGQFVNIVDPYDSSRRARIDSGKLRVGDGNDALTVDGSVKTPDLKSALVYKSPAGGLDCGASAAGVPLGNKDLSRFSKLRIFVKSGPGYQTIVQMRAVAGSEVYQIPWLDYTVPAGTSANGVFSDVPPLSELRIIFCNNAQVFIYGLR